MGDIVTVNELGTSEELFKILRGCGIKGETTHLPYEQCEMSIENIAIEDLVPLSKYVLEDNIKNVAYIYDRLKLESIDIFDLSGRLAWWDKGVKQFIAPPIVEFWEDEGYLLVDGIHRVCQARQQGKSAVTCVVIRGVTTPLVPLPTVWEKVRPFPSGEMPENDEKRDFRFPDAASLKDAMPGALDKVTDQNYQYFLFRDLGALGSSGIREAPGNSTTGGISSD